MAKSITLKFTPREIGRGEWGKEFYLSTFRFPLKEAQKLERRAKAMGLTMSSLVNQLVMTFNEKVDEPKGVKLERTTEATVWGAGKKPAGRKPKAKAKAAAPTRKARKPRKSVEEALEEAAMADAQEQHIDLDAEVETEAPKSSAASLLAKLKQLRKEEAA